MSEKSEKCETQGISLAWVVFMLIVFGFIVVLVQIGTSILHELSTSNACPAEAFLKLMLILFVIVLIILLAVLVTLAQKDPDIPDVPEAF